ncbi:FAD-dependent oxidoreductase [Aureimonas leprariae]|uniref:GMC family oxidoreductase n=1 Tax=Plantimonas leprariae TaxID=2615207 RepID=A0A7V7PQD1_9HYPH|nr:GMC family oxidoreductase [Aureimonas leprariae]KAB0680373.1 GMC family oxidoreductase [Aureimonas leprariae]
MIHDGRGVSAKLDADICIVGAGPAGITLALELADTGLKIVLLESGGEVHDPETQSLYSALNVGIDYEALERTRSRLLGGSSNCWGGWCKPLDPLDFVERDWIPDSGWPFGSEELAEYYVRAHSYLHLGAFDYSEAAWIQELGRKKVATLPLDNSVLTNRLVQFSPPTRYGKAYRNRLSQSSTVNLVLWSNVCEIRPPERTGQPLEVDVQTLSGNRFKVEARSVVLAAGGIENARLLLLSRGSRNCGLGNEHDLVGRYFMDHPRIRSSTLRIANLRQHRRLYDCRLAKTRQRSGVNPNKIAAFIMPTPETQRERRLPNSRSYFFGRYSFEESRMFQAVTALRTHTISRRRFGQTQTVGTGALVKNLLSGMLASPQGALGVLDQAVNLPIASRRLTLETIIEPIPNRDSRISLADGKDRLGLNRVLVDWRLTEQDSRNIRSTTKLIASELVEAKIATYAPQSANDWDGGVAGCWHHMGTTRMHVDPRKGVVDANSKLHGSDHVYCVGSSVFPTAGSDCPTLTLVALAIRLADHFKRNMAKVLLQA